MQCIAPLQIIVSLWYIVGFGFKPNPTIHHKHYCFITFLFITKSFVLTLTA